MGLYYEDGLYRELRERCEKIDQQIVLKKIRKNLMLSWLPFLKLNGLLGPENLTI